MIINTSLFRLQCIIIYVIITLLSITISFRLNPASNKLLQHTIISVSNSKLYSTTPTPTVSVPEVINPCRIKVVGVGGGGGNAVNRMMESSLGVAGVDFWVVNTDVQALSRSMVPNKLNIGAKTSK